MEWDMGFYHLSHLSCWYTGPLLHIGTQHNDNLNHSGFSTFLSVFYSKLYIIPYMFMHHNSQWQIWFCFHLTGCPISTVGRGLGARGRSRGQKANGRGHECARLPASGRPWDPAAYLCPASRALLQGPAAAPVLCPDEGRLQTGWGFLLRHLLLLRH